VLGVAAGFAAASMLILLGDLALREMVPDQFDAQGRTGSAGVLLCILLYMAIFAAVGGYVAARIADQQPVAHALATGVVLLVMSALLTVTAWHTAPGWYHAAALLLIVPATYVGGKIRAMQLARESAAGT